MRCKNCEHVLWNQPAPTAGEQRLCSECGEAYRVADFSFERGKVRFCCPDCDTAYYGTSAQGHLEPAEFDCVGCGRHLAMEQCVLRPHDERREADAMQRVDLPWIVGRGDGRFRRWYTTAALSLTNSGRIAPMLGRAPQPLRAAGFLAINAAVACAGAAVPYLLFGLIGVGAGGGLGGDAMAVVLAIAAYLTIVAALVVGAALPAGAVALGMSAFGAKRGGDRFWRAYEVACYSSGGLLIAVLPCCGGLLGGFWWMVQCAQAFAAVYASEGARLRIAAAALSVVGFVVGVGLVGILVSAL